MVPSLNPIRFRGVVWLVDVDDVLPKPNCDHRMAAPAEREPGEVAYRVDGHLRVISTRLDAEVAIGFLRVQLVCGELGQALQRSGLPMGQPEPALAVLAE
jgi:hypothetical protein